ncbi:hypothetical protein [Mycobacterium sp. shizuoka-1]|uniref:hypothetical protein n=1 Tax=Mycobacterium sp. shizuoka-1 TaxID=2039281 RepID=UPI000C061748|nr:hypothetical protein [Mycobacterium sp. shizuoka-1]GAY15177.1 hypothetical protein MSZK_19030 [Mycobacterium sp. shizuoka-1]
MPEPVAVDIAALNALADRLTRTADDLTAVEIPGVEALPGSALGTLDAPRRVTADVRRLGTDVRDWARSARGSAGDLAAADSIGAQRLPTR